MKYRYLCLLLLFCSMVVSLCAQQDSVDVLDYDLTLDIGNRSFKRIEGSAAVRLCVLTPVDSIALELCPADVDSVKVDGVTSPFRYSMADRRINVPFTGNAGDTITVTVYYRKSQYIASQGWGGFYFDDNIYYNLGIAIYEYPHNVGKAMFPCRDNFHDKASYHFAITAKPGWKAICSGMRDSVVYHSDSSSTWYWTMNPPAPTYLVGVAVAPFHIIEREYTSEYGTYPAILGFLGHDSVNVWSTFDKLRKVIPMYERCFGPYVWEKVGYVSTPKGSMEHCGNIAFTTNCMASGGEDCFSTMCHEFAHSWFGNLLTCAASEDMWINEGGASFCEEVAIQALHADSDPLYYRSFANKNLKDVLLRTHLTDGGFIPVYGPTHQNTYGSTVYDKGAAVWHSLRGYLGDSLFYASMRTLFSRLAFQNVDSWRLRDSLSLYSGVDLTDFFDFHVFNAGFVDYVIDSMKSEGAYTKLYIHQKTYGTTTYANGNKVDVTFFSSSLKQAKKTVTFDGQYGVFSLRLPFTPLFAIVDLADDISKASIGQQMTIKTTGEHQFDDALFYTNVRTMGTADSLWLHVRHHWSNPDTSLSPQYIKMADRFWTVSGDIRESTKLAGNFYYSRLGEASSLDDNLISNASDFSQVRLLYREGAGKDWTVVSKKVVGNSTSGYFVVNNLHAGEYTLAMVDTNYVGVVAVDNDRKTSVRLYPNPSSGCVTLVTDNEGEQLTLDICDNSGRIVCQNIKTVSGRSLTLDLPTGNYLMTVRRSTTKEAVSIKFQIMNF